MKRTVLLVVVIILVGWISCTYKKEIIEYPPIVTIRCDTLDVKYSVQVAAILSANCYSCHGTGVYISSGGGNKLDAYNNLKPYATSGLLVKVISHAAGVSAMPKNGNKLSDCDIAKIRTWVRNGALNN